MQQAKRSQGDALVSARRAYVAAQQQQSRTVSESAEQWLAAMQAASEKIEAAFKEASEADDTEVGHVVIGARVAQLLSEVSPTALYCNNQGRGMYMLFSQENCMACLHLQDSSCILYFCLALRLWASSLCRIAMFL